MPDAVVNERVYTSVYHHKVDEKGRVPIPFRWRPEASDAATEFTLIVWPKHKAGKCLRVLPPDQMAKLRSSIDTMPNNEKAILKRSIGSNSAQARLDSAGRITIPDEMAEAADIKNEAVLVGMLDRFEIWSPKRYEVVRILDDALSSGAFDLME
jgi:MraZ protein